jgi:hypothetical protein
MMVIFVAPLTALRKYDRLRFAVQFLTCGIGRAWFSEPMKRRSQLKTWFALVPAYLCVALGPLRAQDVDSFAKRAERLQEMKRLVTAFRIASVAGAESFPMTLMPAPLLRWNDPSRQFHDGALWAWAGGGGRPLAVVSVGVVPHAQYGEVYNFEFTSTVSGQVTADAGGKFVPLPSPFNPAIGRDLHWAPRGPGVQFQELPDAPGPADSEAGRPRQMRDLAGRFAAWQFNKPPARERYELRLLPRPIYRYADAASGLLDGAIFVFAFGTDPEVMLLLEARRQGQREGQASWQYALARLSRAEPAVSLDRREVWRLPYAAQPAPTDTCYIVRSLVR